MAENKHCSLFILTILFFTSVFCVMASPAHASPISKDINGHWAQNQIEKSIANDIVSGYPDGTFKPDNNISRAEFFTMANKAFGFKEKSSSNFSDVKSSDWFADQISIAHTAGYISGYEDGTIRPNNNISRQEAAAITARIVKTSNPASVELVNKFKDAGAIPSWAREAIASTVSSGIMSGYPDQTFKPLNYITRAEAVVVLNKSKEITIKPPVPVKSNIFDKAGTYGPASGTETIQGDVTISASGVILRNTAITGNLTIAEAVGNGDAELNSVKVEGTTYIYGGGENSITINQCELNKAVVNKKDGKIRIVLSKDSSIKTLVADSGLKLTGQGKITDLTINSSGVEVEPKPINKPSIKSGISTRVGGETLSGTTSSSGGGGSSGSSTVTTASVSTADQLNTALANASITTITFTGNITASPTVTRSLTINFGAYTLTGNLTFNHTGTGTSVLTGNTGNRIIGNLRVDTANASFNNGVAVSGAVTIANVAPASWTESADGNTITITDPNGATITITGSPGAVTVTEDASGNLTITVNPGATVTNITINAPVNIEVSAGATVTAITAEAGSGGSTITNNGNTGTLTVNASINLVANEAPSTTTIGATGSAVITGTQANSITKVNVTDITVTAAGNAATVINGGTLQMSASATPTNATNKNVTWSVTNGTGTATISSTGLLTATGAGTVTVKATAQDGSGAFGEKAITIQAAQAGEAVILSKVSGAGMPTSQVKVQINSSYVNTYTLYFDGAPLASTTNGIVTIATAVLNDLSRVGVLYNSNNYSTTNGGTWQ